MEVRTVNSTACSLCENQVLNEEKFCSSCGFPEKGTEKEQSVFHANRVMEKNKNIDSPEKIDKARKTLYWLAGLFVVVGVFYYSQSKELLLLVINLMIASVYIGLSFLAKKKPFSALLSALLLYLMIQVLSAISDPSTIYKAIIIKIIIITYLSSGVYAALQTSNNK